MLLKRATTVKICLHQALNPRLTHLSALFTVLNEDNKSILFGIYRNDSLLIYPPPGLYINSHSGLNPSSEPGIDIGSAERFHPKYQLMHLQWIGLGEHLMNLYIQESDRMNKVS